MIKSEKANDGNNEKLNESQKLENLFKIKETH